MEQINLDLLHKQTELFDLGYLVNQKSGKTTVVIHKILGFIEVAQPGSTMVVIAHDSKWRKVLYDKIVKKIKEYKIDCLFRDNIEILTKNAVHVIFMIPTEIIDYGLMGINITNYIIDDYDLFLQKHLDKADMIIDYLEHNTKGD